MHTCVSNECNGCCEHVKVGPPHFVLLRSRKQHACTLLALPKPGVIFDRLPKEVESVTLVLALVGLVAHCLYCSKRTLSQWPDAKTASSDVINTNFVYLGGGGRSVQGIGVLLWSVISKQILFSLD